MTMRLVHMLAVLVLGFATSTAALAASGGNLQQAGTDIGDRASLQRGAQLYMNYCSGCHSLNPRYRTFPWRTTSLNASIVSSSGVAES